MSVINSNNINIIIYKYKLIGEILKLYNSLSRDMEELIPLNDRKINMFVCGQTVYDDAHIGHAKTYINFDVIVRWLRFKGYEVKYVQNITDVDDKIIKRARENGISPIELAREYENKLMEDMDSIGVKNNVSVYPRSHDYIEQIREQIQLLIEGGYAYAIDGDIYYNVSKFGDYTKLSGMSLNELKEHRIEPKEGKINVYDFALWKSSKLDEPSWDITLDIGGKNEVFKGRPGWHIEDTAMTATIFGPQYDIHGGAKELMFPHHTNEIAQAEAAFNKKPFVKYWLHSGVLNIKGEKMSKSLKNFITIRDVVKKYGAEALRLMVESTHYRKDIDFDVKLLEEAANRLSVMYTALSMFYNMESGTNNESKLLLQRIEEYKKEFGEAMDNDFNTPLALSRISAMLDEIRNFSEKNNKVGTDEKNKILNIVGDVGRVIGILDKDFYKKTITEELKGLIEKRANFRKEGKFGEADAIRDKLNELDIGIEDRDGQTIWYWKYVSASAAF